MVLLYEHTIGAAAAAGPAVAVSMAALEKTGIPRAIATPSVTLPSFLLKIIWSPLSLGWANPTQGTS
jgi:hypothetical protein